MEELNRIKDIIHKVEENNFLIKEQFWFGDDGNVGFWGGAGNLLSAVANIFNLGADALGGLTELIKDITGKTLPFIVNTFDNTALIERTPSQGELYEVSHNTAEALIIFSKSSSLTDSVVYNVLVLVTNFIDGVDKGTVKFAGKKIGVAEALETLTVSIAYAVKGKKLDHKAMKTEVLNDDGVEEIAKAVSALIISAFPSGVTTSPESQSAIKTLSEFFVSGILPWHKTAVKVDRLKGDWAIQDLYNALASINISSARPPEKELSEFERKLFAEFDCARELRKKLVVKYSSKKKEEYGVVEDNGYRFIIREKDGKFYGAIQYKGEVISRIREFNCSGYNTFYDEGPETDLNEQQQYERVDGMTYTPLAGTKFTIVMTQAEYDKIKAHNAPKPEEEPTPKEDPVTEPTPEVQPSDNEAAVDDTDTDIEVKPKPEEKPKSNVDKLIEVLIDNGYDERAAKVPNLRAVDGSVAVSNYLGRIVTQKEYEVKEEDYYADIFMKSILDGKTKFKKGTEVSTHDAKAKEENRIIDTTVGIEQPTEIEKRKLEELGSDADAVDRRNTLLFDKKRIKTIRLTSDNSTVIYVANEDITDLVSQITRSLDKTFGGTWVLDETRNKYLTKNKIFIFKKVK